MQIEGWWIFYGDKAFQMSVDNVPAKFSNPTKIDDQFVKDFMLFLCCERREAGFMAMGLGESINRASIKERKAVVVDGIEYIPAAMVIFGNGFSFSWK